MPDNSSPSSRTPRIAVLVVTFNGREHVDDVLGSLQRQSRPADQVVLVDNASTDGSTKYVRAAYPWVELVALPTNTGFAEGNNAALRHARADYVALLNSDAIADERWLAELAATLDADPSVAAAVPKIYRADAPGVVEQAGADFNSLGHCWTRGFNKLDRGQLDRPAEVAVLTGCSALIRTSALRGEPLFDPSFFMYYEELELSLRLRGRGGRIVYVPSAVVHHKGMQSVKRATGQPELFQQRLCNRNRLKILAKYFPLPVLLRGLPLNLLSLLYWNATFARHGGPLYALRAVWSQAAFFVRGLAERPAARGVDARLWLPWMRRQGLRELLAVRRSRVGDG